MHQYRHYCVMVGSDKKETGHKSFQWNKELQSYKLTPTLVALIIPIELFQCFSDSVKSFSSDSSTMFFISLLLVLWCEISFTG